MENKRLFGIHMKDRNSAHSEARPHICIGWPSLGDLSQIMSKDALIRLYEEKHPGKPRSHISQNVGQVWRFCKEASVGDYVLHQWGDIIYIGEIVSDYYMDAAVPDQTPDYMHNRDVRWLKKLHKAVCSEKLLNSLGSAMSFFGLDRFSDEVESLLNDSYLNNIPLYTCLKESEDIEADAYDGSFELTRSIVEAYRGEDENTWDYSDLEAIYLATVGTWRIGFPVKKERIQSSHLPSSKKISLVELVDRLEQKTLNGEYVHYEHEGKREMGMFGVAKPSMKSVSKVDSRRLINLFLAVLDANEGDEAISLVAQAMSEGEIKDFKTGKLSTILFCLKPNTFPIMNGNQGVGSGVFEMLGIPVEYVSSTDRYARNTREIASFRDKYFKFKNYRVFDVASFSLKQTSHDPEADKSYWLLIANLNIWSFGELAIGGEQSYTFKNDKGNLRQIPRNFKAAKPGDLFIGFEGAPKISFVAYGEISKVIEDEEVFFVKNGDLKHSVPKSTAILDPALSDLEGLPNFQGSLFRLSKKQYDRLMEMAEEEPTEPQTPITLREAAEPYTKGDFLKEVYVEEAFYEKTKGVLLSKKNIVLQGPPGVGKTFMAKRLCYTLMGEKDESRIGFVQFHQSYSYEDFVRGYKPTHSGGFVLQDGVFYEFCQKAKNDPARPYFFIIDEINRGNISRIFGELLMLIEDSHRGESVALAYKKEKDTPFSVPENVYIIGMMNTADRSLALLDYALRRRFSFISMEPAFQGGLDNGFAEYLSGLNWPKLDSVISCVKELNEAIKETLGKGFVIGHSYFTRFKAIDDTGLALIVEYEIIPTVEEYFIDDEKKRDYWVKRLRDVIA